MSSFARSAIRSQPIPEASRKQRWYGYAFALGVALFPAYLFPSGQPQLAHVLLLFFATAVFFEPNTSVSPLRRDLAWMLAILGWMTVRQLLYFAETFSLNYREVIFFGFNLLIFYQTVKYLKGIDRIVFLYWATCLAIIFAIAATFFAGASLVDTEGARFRAIGLFNNPNQLGYFSLCAAGIITAIRVRFGIGKASYYLAFGACLYLSMLSLSKAALVGIIFYTILWLRGGGRKQIVGIVALLAVSVIIALSDFSELKILGRLASIGQQGDDTLEARGYGILFTWDLRWLWGWGDGYARSVNGFEVHSTLASVLVRFGLVGFVPILIFIMNLFSRLARKTSLLVAIGLFAPTLLYGITHNGSRFTVVWVYLALLVVCSSVNFPMQRSQSGTGSIRASAH